MASIDGPFRREELFFVPMPTVGLSDRSVGQSVSRSVGRRTSMRGTGLALEKWLQLRVKLK